MAQGLGRPYAEQHLDVGSGKEPLLSGEAEQREVFLAERCHRLASSPVGAIHTDKSPQPPAFTPRDLGGPLNQRRRSARGDEFDVGRDQRAATTSKSAPLSRFSRWRSSLFQCRSGAPE